jgi:6-phosphofructokinase 2
MKKIITLTVNPAIDASSSVAGIRPTKKLRCSDPLYHAGGGGINISRAIKKLGGESLCLYLAGGPTGTHLKELLVKEGIHQKQIPIKNWTRENISIVDSTCGDQYRFVLPGPTIRKSEWQKALTLLNTTLHQDDYLVASGSLAPGIPSDFYAKVAQIANKNGAKFILDTSGNPLIKGADAGVFLLKPNLLELSTLCGVTSISALNIERLARKFLDKKTCEMLVISMGARGAMLITPEATQHIPAPTVHQKSTIGAGDSMVAGMLIKLFEGKSPTEIAEFGVACGCAATMNPGTQLCDKSNAEDLYQWIKAHRISPKKPPQKGAANKKSPSKASPDKDSKKKSSTKITSTKSN